MELVKAAACLGAAPTPANEHAANTVTSKHFPTFFNIVRFIPSTGKILARNHTSAFNSTKRNALHEVLLQQQEENQYWQNGD